MNRNDAAGSLLAGLARVCRPAARTTAAVAATLSLLLSGCMPGPKYQRPTAPAATAPAYKESSANFQDADGWKVARPEDAMLKGKWWEIYQQPELNALEEQLNINNQTIKEYFENLMAARALIRETKAQYWPTVTVGPSWSRAKSSGNLGKSSTANAGSTSSTWAMPLDVSWTPDFFGKIRSQVREEQYAAQVSAADLENEKLVEEASLAEYYFELRGQDALQKVLDDTVVADQKALDLTRHLYETGIDDYSTVVTAEATLKAAQSSQLNLGVARAQYEHAIAMLIGKPATDFAMPVKGLLAAPPPIPIGLPSQLLQRRPDIAAAERTLAEANATIGIGYGAFFPDVTLSAEGGFEASQFQHWFDWPSRFWSIGPSLSETLFNGGEYRAALQQYTAIYNGDVATYRQTVLTAFQQVEDYLAATRILSQQVIRQQEAVDAEQKYLDLELSRYQNGLDPYIDVTTAQTTLLSDQQTLATLQVDESVASIELIQALGGGWDVSQLPTPNQLSAKPAKTDYVREK
ncbi:efflux transporter outer membrane subunit [Silvibacterium dinghuense]|uniref:Efflux transporter outer membrane subunit n=1 Tax=Silvibacterium dinghuense TaxID=1560006 RepID=A0A4Q1SEU2_9BACT|nr:efflux transporter outer membrane subunit [Silvibacterium dinghuense]RXS95625.1 efflux transporter outer membrane subunit [Silvibacterium dinghuense]GGH14496.1 outer membrane efflux lipoprotein [Silvibacterium dinghuense]